MKFSTSLLVAAAVAVFGIGCEEQQDQQKQPQKNQQPGQQPNQQPGQQPGAPNGQAQQQPLFQPAPGPGSANDQSSIQLPPRPAFSGSVGDSSPAASPESGGVIPADGSTGLSPSQPVAGETIRQSSGEDAGPSDDGPARP